MQEKMRCQFVPLSVLVCLLLGLCQFTLLAKAQDIANGYVFHDVNGNGILDGGEIGIPDVMVSNGSDVAVTDAEGAWSLPVSDDTTLFVIKPSGWMTPVCDDMLPKFYYVHKPQGSPELKYPGVPPTGPLPDSIDFPLVPSDESGTFDFVLFGDTQPRNQQEIDYITHDVVEELVGVNAAFGVTLGDVVYDDLNMFEPINRAIAHVGLPWYNVIGNHDKNMDVSDDEIADETWTRVYGPNYYAFEYASTMFFVLDNVVWTGDKQYHSAIGELQLKFIKNVLDTVEKDRLVVFLMHIPLTSTRDKEAFFEIVQEYPNLFTTSAHWHRQQHFFYDAEQGWSGDKPLHHLVHGTVCGSWWRGIRNEFGIPHATQSDGVPNGYSIVTIQGNQYKIRFKAARRPAGFQMLIHLPEEIRQAETDTTEVVVNVFAGSPESRTAMRLNGEGEWITMSQTERECPFYLVVHALDTELPESAGLKLPNPNVTAHIWVANLPANIPEGVHRVDVQTTDMFGQTYLDHRLFRVVNQ